MSFFSSPGSRFYPPCLLLVPYTPTLLQAYALTLLSFTSLYNAKVDNSEVTHLNVRSRHLISAGCIMLPPYPKFSRKYLPFPKPAAFEANFRSSRRKSNVCMPKRCLAYPFNFQAVMEMASGVRLQGYFP